MQELALHNGKNENYPDYISSCGFIFPFKDTFAFNANLNGRDVTYRHILHFRGINLDQNDDGGK